MAEAHRRYEFDYKSAAIRLKNRRCPRCGSIMAHHVQPEERWQCGKCGYTDFVRKR